MDVKNLFKNVSGRWQLAFIFIFGITFGFCLAILIGAQAKESALVGIIASFILTMWSTHWPIWQQAKADLEKSEEAWGHLTGVANDLSQKAALKIKAQQVPSCQRRIIIQHGITQDRLSDFYNDSYLQRISPEKRLRAIDFRGSVKDVVDFGSSPNASNGEKISAKCDKILQAYSKLIS